MDFKTVRCLCMRGENKINVFEFRVKCLQELNFNESAESLNEHAVNENLKRLDKSRQFQGKVSFEAYIDVHLNFYLCVIVIIKQRQVLFSFVHPTSSLFSSQSIQLLSK